MFLKMGSFSSFLQSCFHTSHRSRSVRRRSRRLPYATCAVETLEVRPLLAGLAVVFDTPLGTTTAENGTIITVKVKLNQDPILDTTLKVNCSDETEGITDLKELTFDSSNWDTWQTVQVKGMNDTEEDGDIWYSLAFVKPANPNMVNPVDVTLGTIDLLNLDLQSKIKLAPLGPGEGTYLNHSEMGRARYTNERGTVTHTFTLSLRLAPNPGTSVTIPLATSDSSEGTISVSSVTFTSANWNPRTVTVTGVDDSDRDGDQAYQIITGAAVSTDPWFNGVDPPDVPLINVDNERVNNAGAIQLISESGTQTQAFVMLDSQPADDVIVTSSVTDSTEGVIISGSSLTFTPSNWDTPQYVVVAGVDDSDIDGDIAFLLQQSVSSSDSLFDDGAVNDIQLVNQDDDTLSISVSGGSVVEGGAITFTITVSAPSSWSGTLVLSASTMACSATSGSDYTAVSGVNLNFNSSTLTQTITVNTIDDSDMEGDENFYLWLSVLSGGPVDPGSAMMMAFGTIWDNDFTMPGMP